MNSSELAALGINLFASVKVEKLPCDIIDNFKNQNIVIDPKDTFYLMANGGSELWNHLPHPLNEHQHPIDQFSINLIKKIDKDARILFPHNQWTIPLQRLGRFLNLSRPSLLGLDINNHYGVWFAFRGAFLSSLEIETPAMESFESPCTTCLDKPCIKVCPANAVVSSDGFKLNNCATYRLTSNSNCLDKCLSRLACPYQNQHQYKMEQIHYHMTRVAHVKNLSEYSS